VGKLTGAFCFWSLACRLSKDFLETSNGPKSKRQLKLPRDHSALREDEVRRFHCSDNWRPNMANTQSRRKRKDITKMMNTLTRWEPLREMEDLQSRLSTLFGRTPMRRGNGKESITLPEWTPLADITEDDMEYLIKAELPELRKEDVKVTVENGVLTIAGERKFEKEEKKKKYHRVERGYGSFVRTFALPEDADADRVKAQFKQGILEVHLPKNEKAKPKQIEVNVA
jgi:HSP20 family protein